MKKNYVLVSIFMVLIILLGTTVYALDTIRVYISEMTNTGDSSYPYQSITTLSWAAIVDKDNDGALLWDYFSWYYYDRAYWVFSFDLLDDNVKITNRSHSCSWNTTTHDGYELEGYSWNNEFWAVNFSGVYICVPKDENSDVNSYIGWEAYSDLIWFQNFDGILSLVTKLLKYIPLLSLSFLFYHVRFAKMTVSAILAKHNIKISQSKLNSN